MEKKASRKPAQNPAVILYSIGKQTDDEKHEQEVVTEKSDESEKGQEPIEQRKV